ncbi:MAG: type III pantothenate kinase [Treponema sp.]
MVILIDVGNTNIVFGISDGEKIINTLRTETVKRQDFEYAHVLEDLLRCKGKILKAEGAVLSSVVPEVTGKICRAVQELYGIRAALVNEIADGCLTIATDAPDKLGMDLKADAAGALKKYPNPQVIFDLGTATTCSVLDEQGRYIGGSIMPGLKISLEALAKSASQLSMIDFMIPVKEYVGKNTQDAMRVGMLYGHALMLEGFARAIQKQFSKPMHVSLTGGLSHIVKSYMSLDCVLDPYLTLEGLLYLYQDWKKRSD